MYSVYILKSINNSKYYTGKTNDIQRRLEEHNAGKSYYTKRYVPWQLIYVEEFTEENLAAKREKYFKSAAGRRFLKS